MSDLRVFVSFDREHDRDLYERLLEESRAPGSGFEVRVLFTVGDRIGEYQPPGVLDGLGAWRREDGTVRVFVNHELGSRRAYPYRLANGAQLRGSRISYFDIDRDTLAITSAGLAWRGELTA